MYTTTQSKIVTFSWIKVFKDSTRLSLFFSIKDCLQIYKACKFWKWRGREQKYKSGHFVSSLLFTILQASFEHLDHLLCPLIVKFLEEERYHSLDGDEYARLSLEELELRGY